MTRAICIAILMLLLTIALVAVYSRRSPELEANVLAGIDARIAKWTANDVEWTPQRIAADSAGYARYAQERSKELISEFNTNLQRVHSQIRELSSLIEENDQSLEAAQSELVDLCETFALARDSNSWPVHLQGVSFDEETLTRAIGNVKQQVEQREELGRRIRRERERKKAETARLELMLSSVKLDQIALSGSVEDLRIQDTVQNMEQLEDMVRAATDTGTDGLVRITTETRESLLSEDELNLLLEETVPKPAAPLVPLSVQTLPQMLPDTWADGRTESCESGSERAKPPEWRLIAAPTPANQHPTRTLTPAQKDALGIKYENPLHPVEIRETQSIFPRVLTRSDHRVPLLPPPDNRRFRQR